MKLSRKYLLAGLLLIMMPVLAAAQTDNFGVTDTLYAELARIDKTNWSITLSFSNDEWIEALSLPFFIESGEIKIVADSAVYTGGRVAHFDYKGFRADSSIQCFTLGLMANFGPMQNGLAPGSGRLATVFVSSLEGEPLETLAIDSTTTPPSNSLMMIAQRVQPGDPPDSIPFEELESMTIVPAFVLKTSE